MLHPAQKFGSQNIITTVKHSVQVFWQRDLPHEEQIKLTTETKNYTARQQLCILYKKVVSFSPFALSQKQVDFFKYIYKLAVQPSELMPSLVCVSYRKWKAYNTSSNKATGLGASLSRDCQGEMRPGV